MNLCRILSLILVLVIPFNVFAQSSEHIVILWDVTGSLLPKESGLKTLGGKALPTYKYGNGLFVDLQKAVIECIEYAEEDPSNELTIVTFHDNIRDTFSRKMSVEGKKDLIDFVTNYIYQPHNHTNIVDPVKKFYSLLTKDKINYMFLFTDGENDQPATRAQFIPTLDSWSSKTGDYNAYGFYVLVHPDADKPDIRNSVESQNNFWIVPDAKVRIKVCSFPSTLSYNVRDEKGPKQVSIRGKYAGAAGDIMLSTNDEYYDVICSDLSIKNGKISFEVKPKVDVTPPDGSHIIDLKPQLSGADPYTFVGPQEISLEVTNLPERNMNLTIEDNYFGKASYYESFLLCGEENKPVETNIEIDFSDQAKIEHSSAMMKVYLVDKKSEEKVDLASHHFTVCINGEAIKGDSFKLTPEMSNVTLSVLGSPDTEDGTYYGRIELVPSDLDNCSINGTPDIYKWRFQFEQKCNPLKLGLLLGFSILIVAILLWRCIFRLLFFPTFGSIQKTFTSPNQSPLIVKFKGARLLVVSAVPQKKQSVWNQFWTGKIIYKTYPAFDTPVMFKPSRGRKILVKVPVGSYQVFPNPMPGIGSAKIVDIRKNLKIDVN